MTTTFQDIERSFLFKKTVRNYLGQESIETIVRSTSFIVRLKQESSRNIRRIILLSPGGFTADSVDLLSPHPEAREAKIKIMGKINPTKKGFKPLLNEIQLDYSYSRKVPTQKTSAYAKFSEKYCGTVLRSWKSWFFVVKENGRGYFHNLINLSNDWVVLLLEKKLLDQKEINIRPHLESLSKSEALKLQKYVMEIEKSGDTIFKKQKFITDVMKLPLVNLAPILILMLNVQETGRHENCTFFALLLRIARKERKLVLCEVRKASKLRLAPYYYLDELEKKLRVGNTKMEKTDGNAINRSLIYLAYFTFSASCLQ